MNQVAAPTRKIQIASPSTIDNPSLRLFFIVENDEPNASAGGFYALFKFAEALSDLGHLVRIYASKDQGWIAPKSNLQTIYRPRVPRRGRILTKFDRFLSKAAASLVLEREIQSFKPDWILGVLTYSAIKAESLGRRFGIQVANFIYECPPWVELEIGPERFAEGFNSYSKILWQDTRAAYLGSTVLFPNSNLSRSYNSEWLDGKFIFEPIHPGVDIESMPMSPGPSGEPIALPDNCHHVLYVGRLSDGKNVGDLIKAYDQFQKPVELHICGTGPLTASLKQLAAGYPGIRFHGYVSDDLLWSLFRQCDIVAYPTGFEGFGMPPMQALYFGKPCVASDLPIFRSIFGSRLDYFPLGQIEALAFKINELLGDPVRRHVRGAEGRDFVLKNFTWKHAALRIECALKDDNHARSC